MPNQDPQTRVSTGMTVCSPPVVYPVTQIIYVNEEPPPVTPVAGDGITHYFPLASATSDGVMSAQDKIFLDSLVNKNTNTLTRYEFIQSTPSALWVINHNLNSYPEVVILDNNGDEIFSDIEYTSENVVTIRHGSPYAGKAILTGKTVSGNVYLFNTPLMVWVIPHNLNGYPEVVVLDNDGEEIIPDIQYTSENVITIVHGSPYTGKVILI